MSDVSWLFVDLNSYFASVEQEVHPELRGKPVGVVPMMAETTCCIAASYEAKAFGIKTGTIVADARKMCPGMIFVEAKHKIYMDYHQKIMAAVEHCHPIHAVMSVDEAALHLRGRDTKIENAIKLADEIRQSVFGVGSQLKCSIGISTNKFLSKVASDMQKPNGLTVLKKEDLPHKLFRLKPRDFPGIGSRMEDRLHKYGITTVEQLFKQDIKMMRTIWGGVIGERFYRWIRGDDFEDSVRHTNKSISRSHVLAPEFRNQEGSYSIAQKLLHKAATQLRKIDCWAQGMHVSIRYTDQTKWSEEIKMHECQDSLSLSEIFRKMWKMRKTGTPMKVTITLFNLITDSEKTLSFFDNQKRIDLSKAMDSLNLKYGKYLVYPGGMHQSKKAAPTRIAFTSIPDFSNDDDVER